MILGTWRLTKGGSREVKGGTAVLRRVSSGNTDIILRGWGISTQGINSSVMSICGNGLGTVGGDGRVRIILPMGLYERGASSS